MGSARSVYKGYAHCCVKRSIAESTIRPRPTRSNSIGLRSLLAKQNAEDSSVPQVGGDYRYAARVEMVPRHRRPAFALVMALWWACQDLNLGPHPYQRSTAERCANRPFRWSRYSVSPTRMG